MGNLTAKTSGEIASFMTPAKTNIKSLKVHFSPKQLGTGDPSPENVREIEGWDGVEVNGSGKNLAHIFGYGTQNITNTNVTQYKTTNNYGTKINTTIYNNPDTPLIIEQSQAPNATTPSSYQNGYIVVGTDNLIFEKSYNVSFKVSNITNNLLDIDYPNYIRLLVPNGDAYNVDDVVDNTLIFKDIKFSQNTNTPKRQGFEIRISGMSFTLSEFMVTPVDEDNFDFEPYQGNIYLNSWTKNLLDIWEKPNGYKPSSKVNGNYDWSKEWIVTDELKGKTITYSTFVDNTNANGNGYVHIWTKNSEGNYIKTNIIPPSNKQIIAGESGWSYVNLILTDDIYSVIFGITVSANATAKYPMVELGSEPTEYQPYVGTVYGGYIDLISGELVEEWGMFTVDEPDSTWRVAAYNRITINFPRKYIFGSRLLKDKSMCTILPENHTDWNYGYIDNVASVTNPHALSLNYTGNGGGWSELFGEEATNENVKEHLQEIGFAICATLAEPITHQLTPTQLKSFIGQNNFWSNADYIEIEYDLIETIDIQKAKQKIILNQPQLKTISDKVVSFNTDMVAPMKNCKIYFKPIQLGSGNPSPTNVRDINGWTGIDSYVNGDKISVDWTSDAGTVYGGYLDLAKNEVVAEYESISDTWGNWGTLYDQGDGTELRYKKFSNNIIGDSAGLNNSYCNIAKYNYNNNNGTIHFYIVSTSKNCRIYLPSGTDTSLQIQAVAKLKTPIHYPLSSPTLQQLLTIKSTNHIWSETNGQQIDVKYWTHKNLTPVPLTNYLENQTWTDSAYISSSGKKTTNTVSASHFLTNQILLEAGTYVLSGFSYYAGSDSTRYRIHAYDSTGKWVKQITFQEIDNLSPVDISFTLDTDTYVNVSIAMDFDGVLAKIN